MKKISTKDFIEKANKIHLGKYDYSKTEYVNSRSKVIVTCKLHGDFKQRPDGHYHKEGCPECNNQKLTTKDFIEKAKVVHGDRYNYDKVEYVNCKLKIIIICKLHGDFTQISSNHGCPNCGIIENANNLRGKTEDFIINAKLVHGEKYNYDKVNYIQKDSLVIITCLKHGDFNQTVPKNLRKSR